MAGWAPGLAAAIIVVAVALAGGGYGGVALGLGTIAVWVTVIIVVLAPGELRTLTRPFAIALAALAVLAALAALSLSWTSDRDSGFADVVRLAAYLGVFLLAGLLLRSGAGRPALAGIGAGLVAVSLLALGSRLLGIGAGDADLVATMQSSAGRLSYPVGYWNALGSLAAMAVPVLVWLGAATRGRAAAVTIAALPPVLLTAYMTSSRGALVAAAIGAAIAIAASRSRGRAVAVTVVGALATVPAIAAATLGTGILDGPGSPPGRAEAVVCVALLAGVVVAAMAASSLLDRAGATAARRLRMRYLLAAALVAIAAAVLLVGPGEIAGDFAVTEGKEATAGGNQLSVSGSGRAQFWSAALDAFAADPKRGIGAGAFGFWWNRHGSLETPVQNAHSEPLELLAELGPLGLLAFLAFFATVAAAGISRARRSDGAAAGAALGLVATGLVGFLIDWTWDVPAVAVPVLVAAAVLAGRSLDPALGREAAAATPALRIPAPLLAIPSAAVAVAAIWAGGVLAVATDRLEASADAVAVGDLPAAAAAARAAAAAEPWAAEPWAQLAE
ncbi:MAG TPA: O-antigen ligase family protein, partial [Solirubrobacterales bacterium]|nr:O-antigen ligase family protein [Solirubrobacterales bacterium]